MTVVSGQWALNETASSFTGLLNAVTSDNVAPHTLTIAEAFGATLAISPTTRQKLDTLHGPSSPSYTIKFLKSKIGFAKGDASSYLAASEGGIRFLGLASALLCMDNTYTAASTLHDMIMESAPTKYSIDSDNFSIPTITMFQRLLDVLEPRLSRTGFATYISGYQTSLKHFCPWGDDDSQPSKNIVKALVNAFRDTHRLGSGDAVEVRVYHSLPWIVAFTHWMTGAPPSIIGVNGRVLFDDTTSRASIELNATAQMNEEIRVIHYIERPRVLWSGPSDDRRMWSGMISLEHYGDRQLTNLDLDTLEAKQALSEALSASLWRATEMVHVTETSEHGTPFHPALGIRMGVFEDDFHIFRSRLFGREQVLKSTIARYLGVKVDIWVRASHDRSFPALEQYLETLVCRCGCQTCTHNHPGYENPRSLGKQHARGAPTNLASLAASICGKTAQACDLSHYCALMQFWAKIALITAEILALSLFDCNEPILVFWSGGSNAKRRADERLVDVVYSSIFWSSPVQFCRVADILGFATSLIGHEVAAEVKSRAWIASAFRGQVIYPFMFDLGGIDTHPLILGGGPGQLLFRESKPEMVISRGASEERDYDFSGPTPGFAPSAVTRVCNLFPKDHLEWLVSLAGARAAISVPNLSFSTSRCLGRNYNPCGSLITATRSLFVSCGHEQSKVLLEPAQDCVFSLYPVFGSTRLTWNAYHSQESMEKRVHLRKARQAKTPFDIQILPTAGNEELRLFAMCSPVPGVVRNKACLQCCIDVCRKSGLEYIVL